MADRQWFVEGVLLYETGEEEYFVDGVLVCEDQGNEDEPPVETSTNKFIPLQLWYHVI